MGYLSISLPFFCPFNLFHYLALFLHCYWCIPQQNAREMRGKREREREEKKREKEKGFSKRQFFYRKSWILSAFLKCVQLRELPYFVHADCYLYICFQTQITTTWIKSKKTVFFAISNHRKMYQNFSWYEMEKGLRLTPWDGLKRGPPTFW